jgi:hypothetical protein
MPETPDFEQLARIIICGMDAEVIKRVIKDDHSVEVVKVVSQVEAQLRYLWNARGAADIAAIDRDLSEMAGPYVKHLAQLLRTLDRDQPPFDGTYPVIDDE